MDYCLFPFDALNFFYMGSLYQTLIFSMKTPQIFHRNRKVHLKIRLEANFHNISNIILRFFKTKTC